MKLRKYAVVFVLLFGLLSLPAWERLNAEESSVVEVPVSLSYYSTYWWRGIELNGKSNGVIWPGLGVKFPTVGLALKVAAGISQDYAQQSDKSTEELKANKKSQKTLTEMDYGISYSTEFAKLVAFGIGVMYVHYPYYDAADTETSKAKNPSFWEGSLSLGLKVLLNPTVECFYDYYVEENNDKNPRNADYYVKLSLTHNLIEKDGFSLYISPWVGYYNNAYLKRKGWSDAGGTVGIKKDHGKASFGGFASYARSLDKDFQLEYAGIGRLKNHIWAGFDMGYAF